MESLLFQSQENYCSQIQAETIPSLLIVDDEPLMCWSLEHAFKKTGFQVVCVDSGNRAIEQLLFSHIDILITDIKLPNEDGFQVAAAARRISPEIPVILISAFGDTQTRAKATSAGIKYFFDKPFDLNRIILTVQEILKQQE